MKIQLKRIEADMLDECIQLYQRVFRAPPWNDNDTDEEVMIYFRRFLECGAFLGYAALLDGKIVALSAGFIKPWVKGYEYYIDQFCVDLDLQGHGIGTAFLDEIKSDLHQNNISSIFLLTDREYPSYKFYTKNGICDIETLCCMGGPTDK